MGVGVGDPDLVVSAVVEAVEMGFAPVFSGTAVGLFNASADTFRIIVVKWADVFCINSIAPVGLSCPYQGRNNGSDSQHLYYNRYSVRGSK